MNAFLETDMQSQALQSEAGGQLLSLFLTLDPFEKRILTLVFRRIAEIEQEEGEAAAEEALAQAAALFLGERQ